TSENCMCKQAKLKVGIAVLGTVGKAVAKAIDNGIPGVSLTAISARDEQKSADWLATLQRPPKNMSFEEMALACDVIIECAPAAILNDIAIPVLKAGKILIVLSCGALLSRPDLIDLAKEHGAHIHVPTGALLGLDAVIAAAEGSINSVTMVTRKPVEGLLGAPYLADRGINKI